MKVKPILMNTAMVQATLEGRKTQTRRLVKPEPYAAPIRGLDRLWRQIHHLEGTSEVIKCPFGSVGDLLYVREAISIWDDGVVYRASNPECNGVTKWTPSIHMKREFSRLTLEISDIRIERLQDISEEDAEAEGVEIECNESHEEVREERYGSGCDNGYFPESSRIIGFENLWESINGKGSWLAADPWVWVIEFKVHKVNVDDFIGANNG